MRKFAQIIMHKFIGLCKFAPAYLHRWYGVRIHVLSVCKLKQESCLRHAHAWIMIVLK
jgi:hypothetical protein